MTDCPVDASRYLRVPGADASLDCHPRLRWQDTWGAATGRGVVVGLVDTGVDRSVPDLRGADLLVRSFGSDGRPAHLADHGTLSATLLVGQGRAGILGVAPRARLLVAEVADPAGIGPPEAVREAICWIGSAGAAVIVLPLGDARHDQPIAALLDRLVAGGTFILAAAGNCHPDPVLFPARHPQCVAVGAIDGHGSLLPECSRRPRLDLVTLGIGIAVPGRDGVTSYRRGSSVAAVLAAGAAVRALASDDRMAPPSRAALLAELTRRNRATPEADRQGRKHHAHHQGRDRPRAG